MSRTAVYRHYDAEGRLLYVGRSVHPIRRNREHMSRSEWFAQVARTEIDWHDSAEAARASEGAQITQGTPIHNKRSAHPKPAPRTANNPAVKALKADIVRFCEARGMAKTAFGVAAISDPGFVAGLGAGREPRWSTVQKVRLWMAAQEQGAA